MFCRHLILIMAFLCFVASGAVRAEDGKVSTLDVTTYPVVYTVPEMAGVKVQKDIEYTKTVSGPQRFDLYMPPDAKPSEKLPVVVFINGVGDFGNRKLKNWAIYSTWARLVAAKGYAGINFESDNRAISESISAMFDFIERRGGDFGLDTSRIGVFACSGNVNRAFPYLMGSATKGIKAAAIYYGAGDAQNLRKDLPVFHVLAGRDSQNLIQFEQRMIAKAREQHLPWTIVEAPTLPHAFDALDKSEESLRVIKMTLAFWDSHLKPLPVPSADVDAKARQALLRVYANEWDNAAEIFQEIVAQSPDNADAWHGLANARMNLRMLPEAEEAMLRAIKLEPDRVNSLRQLGQIQQQMNKGSEAIKNLKRAIELGATDGFTFLWLGMSQISDKDYKEAAKSFERSIELGPIFPNTYYNLACAYSLSGEKQKALEALERAVELGFRDPKQMESDTDLNNIRSEARYQALIQKLSSKN